jgi:hypothetical protein
MEAHRRKSPGLSQITWNSEGLEAHTCRPKHLQESSKWHQSALDKEYEMGIRMGCAERTGVLQSDTDRVAMAGQLKPE